MMNKKISYKSSDSKEKKEQVVYTLMKSCSLYNFILYIENNITDINFKNNLIQLAVDYLGQKH